MLGHVEVSESDSLVRREGPTAMSYTEEGGAMLGRPGEEDAHCEDEGVDEVDYVDSDISVLSQFHEDAIHQAGFGYFQWLLLLVVGLGLAADTVEIFVVAYILPSAEVELCMDEGEKGWLGAITFMGMMVGGVVWGNLADRMGRRRTLLSALSVNAVFSVIAAFMPTYGTFMTARFCSGVGIGGSLPIVFAYFCEFLAKADRGRHMSWLLVFWSIGGIYVALMAWAIIPRTGLNVIQEDKEHFSAWHQFLLVCSLPSLAAVVGLVFMPESPRYLLESGREVEAMMVYQHIYKVNNLNNPSAQYQLSELELPSKRPAARGLPPPSPGKSILADMTYSLETFWNSFLQLFIPPYLKVTLVLLILWFTAAFGYYGLTIWFPEYIKLLKEEEYRSHARNYTRKEYDGHIPFNNSIENIRFVSSHFTNCTFKHLILNHVTFENCTIQGSVFENIKSSRTYFIDSEISDSRFVDTDFYDFRFQRCKFGNNVTFLNVTAACQLDFDFNLHLEEVFRENMVGQLAILPGAIVSAFIIDRLGRVKIIGMSMFLSSLAAFFIWFLDTNTAVIAFEAVFNFIFISGWNAVDIATTESYPTHLRTTGYGFLSATCRLGGILGNLSFGSFIGVSRAIPMLTTAAVLLIGGIVSVRLPETKNILV